ncbi:hypothetical protein ACFQU2_23740 [Siccirubricoccus deserti]
MKPGSGRANQIPAVATTITPVQAPSIRRRRPPTSATAPSSGESSAIASPATVCIHPHCAWPVAGSGAMPWVK